VSWENKRNKNKSWLIFQPKSHLFFYTILQASLITCAYLWPWIFTWNISRNAINFKVAWKKKKWKKKLIDSNQNLIYSLHNSAGLID
jgi:hypothetical protein